ncbi:MAG: NAD(P)H-hydrate dehydratase, partial [Mycobacteriales bacterium]
MLTPAALRQWPLPMPDDQGAKQSRGTVLVVGGSRQTPGAVLLAGNAALRAGAGRLQMAGPESVATALAIHVPESLVVALPETAGGDVSMAAGDVLDASLDGVTALLIGPGLQDAEESQALVAELLNRVGPETSVVLDGYGLRGLKPESVAALAGRLVLTPNLGEAAELLGAAMDELGELPDVAARIAERFGAVVSLQGSVADAEGNRWLDEGGHVGLGTSGSGDVLAGLVAGFLARGAGSAQATCWGAFIHSTAG